MNNNNPLYPKIRFIKEIRTKLDFSRRKIGEILGVSREVIYTYENTTSAQNIANVPSHVLITLLIYLEKNKIPIDLNLSSISEEIKEIKKLLIKNKGRRK